MWSTNLRLTNTRVHWGVLLAAACFAAVLPEAARACSCKAHFEVRYRSFKPDVPVDHFEAHQTRRRGETENQCRRRAREAAQACMSGMWRDRWEVGQAPKECSGRLSSGGPVIRPMSAGSINLKRELERAACCGDSPLKNAFRTPAKLYKRTHGGRGCGPNLRTVESRFLSDYTFDCKAVRARERCGRIEDSGPNEEQNTDRPGMDIRSFSVGGGQQQCRRACIDNRNCRSWTYVKDTKKCWLKDGIPWSKRNNCCVSGTVR